MANIINVYFKDGFIFYRLDDGTTDFIVANRPKILGWTNNTITYKEWIGSDGYTSLTNVFYTDTKTTDTFND